MLVENLVELRRRRVERKSVVIDQPLALLLRHKIPQIEVLKEMRPMLTEIVQQIEVEIARARPLERQFELRNRIVARLTIDPRRILRRQLKLLARITLDQRLTNRVLTAGICPRRIEIREACRQKLIDHLLDLLNVKPTVVEFRQPHQPESQLFDLLPQIHCSALSKLCATKNIFRRPFDAPSNCSRTRRTSTADPLFRPASRRLSDSRSPV